MKNKKKEVYNNEMKRFLKTLPNFALDIFIY